MVIHQGESTIQISYIDHILCVIYDGIEEFLRTLVLIDFFFKLPGPLKNTLFQFIFVYFFQVTLAPFLKNNPQHMAQIFYVGNVWLKEVRIRHIK